MSETVNWSAVERSILGAQRVRNGLKAEELREKIDPEPIVQALLSLVNQADLVDIDDLPRLRLKSDILFGVLKKVMPDLRALEVSEKEKKQSTLIIQMEPLKQD